MIMKQKVLALSVAAALAGGAGVANAALSIQEAGVGHALITPYFSSQGGNITILSVTNTDTVNAKAVKVRFRGAVDSDDIFDFQVFLSPADVWNATIYQDPTSGLSRLSTADTSCSIPESLNVSGGNPFVTTRLVSYTDGASVVHSVAEQTREGYVEIFNMADIPPTVASGASTTLRTTETNAANPLFTAIKHVNSVPPCRTSTVSQALLTAIESSQSAAAITVPTRNDTSGTVGADNYTAGQQLTMPTTGLMGNWIILNGPGSLTFAGEMAAIQAATTDQTMIVYSGQTDDSRTVSAASASNAVNVFPNLSLTADRVLQLGTNVGIQAAKYDFPDMSTPYLAAQAGVTAAGSLTPGVQALALSTALNRTRMMNEYATGSAYGGGTDWVASMPTRRYHVAGRGTTYMHQGTGSQVSLTTLNGTSGNVTAPFAGSVGVANCSGTTQTAIVTFATNGRSSQVTTAAAPTLYNREELTSSCTSSTPVFSPSIPTQANIYRLGGEVNVLSWNNSGAASSVLKAGVILSNLTATIGTTTSTEGWGRISLSDGVTVGLPMLGAGFIKASNPQAAANTLGNYGATFKHRF